MQEEESCHIPSNVLFIMNYPHGDPEIFYAPEVLHMQNNRTVQSGWV